MRSFNRISSILFHSLLVIAKDQSVHFRANLRLKHIFIGNPDAALFHGSNNTYRSDISPSSNTIEVETFAVKQVLSVGNDIAAARASTATSFHHRQHSSQLVFQFPQQSTLLQTEYPTILPDHQDPLTILNMAKMSNNAYSLPKSTGWIDEFGHVTVWRG